MYCSDLVASRLVVVGCAYDDGLDVTADDDGDRAGQTCRRCRVNWDRCRCAIHSNRCDWRRQGVMVGRRLHWNQFQSLWNLKNGRRKKVRVN
jgi:hypothetical protein